jgi:hypothetical protein
MSPSEPCVRIADDWDDVWVREMQRGVDALSAHH